MTTPVVSRRHFLIGAALATAAVPFGIHLMGKARAGGLPPLPLDNPQARALAYTDVATSSKHSNYKPGSECLNCQFFTAATGACSVFSGFSVAPKGWCSVWARHAV